MDTYVLTKRYQERSAFWGLRIRVDMRLFKEVLDDVGVCPVARDVQAIVPSLKLKQRPCLLVQVLQDFFVAVAAREHGGRPTDDTSRLD